MGVISSLAALSYPVVADLLRKHGGKTEEELEAAFNSSAVLPPYLR